MTATLSPVLALVLALAAGERARPAAPPGLSWDAADQLARKLDRVRRAHGGDTLRVSERELNSYLNLTLARELPEGVSEVAVRLAPGRFEVLGLVDMDRAQGRLPEDGGLFNPFALVTGTVELRIAGRLANARGFGTLLLEEVRLGRVPVPLAMIEELVRGATRSAAAPQGFDIKAPFRLPYSVQRVRFAEGEATLEF